MGHKAFKWQSQDLNLGGLAPEFVLLIIMLSYLQKHKA
jgi:hypothetical protein